MEKWTKRNIKTKIVFLFLSIGLFSMCQQSNKEVKATQATQEVTVTQPIEKEVKGELKGLEDKQTVTFEAKEGQELTAALFTPDPANIRLNQIISPSGASDGPFGQEVTYSINETGTWKLIVGGSLMQGDAYYGPFTVKITLK